MNTICPNEHYYRIILDLCRQKGIEVDGDFGVYHKEFSFVSISSSFGHTSLQAYNKECVGVKQMEIHDFLIKLRDMDVAKVYQFASGQQAKIYKNHIEVFGGIITDKEIKTIMNLYNEK